MEIYTNLNECPIIQEVRDIEDYCAEDTTRCAGSSIIANIQKNMFGIMGKLTDLSSIIQELPSETADEFYTNMYQIGDDFGTVIRQVMGLDAKAK